MTATSLAGQMLLAVFAHPDDESLACGGTLARLADAGMRVVVVTASRGERGGPMAPLADDAIGRLRAAELVEAATVLGVGELVIGDHPDGDLRWRHVTEFGAELATYMRRHRPAAVITFGYDGLYWHPDHISVCERVTAAVRSLGAGAPPLYYVTMRHGVMTEIVTAASATGWVPPSGGFWGIPADAFGLRAERATITVNVERFVPQKLAAIRCHRSQMHDGDPFARLDGASARRLLGMEDFHRADIPAGGPPVLEQL